MNGLNGRISTVRTIVRPLFAALLLTAVSGAASARAAEKTFIAIMNGGQVVPPSTSQAQGLGYFTYDTALKRLCFSITYSGFDPGASETEAHIHNGKAGTTDTVFFDLEVGSPKKGCVGPFSAKQEKALLRGETYVNIHSTVWVAGELRGQVLPIRIGK